MVPAARWSVVALLALAVCAPAAALRLLPASDTSASAPALAQRARAAIDRGWSGEVRTQGSLSVPLSGSAFGGVARLLGESSQLRVWWQDDDNWRVDRISATGENDQAREGGLAVRWSYEADTARLVSWSSVRLPDDNDLVPGALARRLLDGATASELSRIPPRRVAGRSAAGLRLLPSDPVSTIARVDVWVDESTGIPLRVDVYGQDDTRQPTLSTAVVSFDDESPPNRTLQPRFSPDVDFHRGTSFDAVAGANAFAPFVLPLQVIDLRRRGNLDELGAVGVYGRGPTALVAVPLRSSTAEALHQQLARSHAARKTEHSVALAVGPLSVLLVQGEPGNFLLAGTIKPAALRQAAVDLQRDVVRTR